MADIYSPSTSSRPGLFASLLAAPVVWSVYHFVGYLVVEAACEFGQLNRPGALGLTPLALIVTALTVAALALSAGAGWRAWRRWRAERASSGGQPPGAALESSAGAAFLSLVGALLGLIFSLVILADGVSVLALHPCGVP